MNQERKKTSKKTLRERIAELEREIEEKKDKMTRLLADFDNYRKRMEKEIKEIGKREKEKLILKFIDIYENMKMACNEISHKGLNMVMNQFKKILNEEGVEEINAVGEKFDHNLHHAVATRKSEGEDGIIIEEIKKGYMLNGRVIRPSYVIVAKGD
ncbi:MAG TPA: nucleotide exchange factor GrpE [Thermoplasmatales archaeon]|nr:nucleotide exchange factor GrpE [Thermoplasmatales archaeon]